MANKNVGNESAQKNPLSNPNYDDEQLMQIIANDSSLFRGLLLGLIQDTDAEFPCNKAWLGTLNQSGKDMQIQLLVSQVDTDFIDED
jgi:hypothetical protein